MGSFGLFFLRSRNPAKREPKWTGATMTSLGTVSPAASLRFRLSSTKSTSRSMSSSLSQSADRMLVSWSARAVVANP